MAAQRLTIEQAMARAKEAAKLGKVPEAVKIYSAIIKQQPNNTRAKEALKQLRKSSTNTKALPKEKTLGLSQTKIDTLIGLYNQGNLLGAEAECRKLLKVYPRELVIINLLGAVLTKQMKFNEAIASFKNAIQLNPTLAEAYLNLASALKELGRNRDTAKNCKKAIKLKPNFAEAHCVLGEAQKNLEQPEDAIKSFKKSLQLKPGFPEACIGLGDVYLRQGLMEKGLRMKRRGQHVICFDPDSGVSILRGE